ncbi:MAG: flagellar FliJ family protein [Verrucomicrobia bacterium]|nr:flagellar FliJ family protein [Verrucomicrobiota bacterium]
MKRFRFPLQPVVVLRAHRESRAREAFAAAVHAYVESEEFLQSTRRRVAEFEVSLFAGRQGCFNAAEEAHTLNGYRREVAAEADAERAMITARDLMHRRRNEYLEAHRQLEVVKRLEQKARGLHRAATNREEQAEYDEFSTRQAARRAELVAI